MSSTGIDAGCCEPKISEPKNFVSRNGVLESVDSMMMTMIDLDDHLPSFNTLVDDAAAAAADDDDDDGDDDDGNDDDDDDGVRSLV